MSRTIVKKGPKKALPPFEFDLRYKGQRRTISIPAEGHTPQTAHQAAAKQLREEVDAELAQRDLDADDEAEATNDVPEPPTPQTDTSQLEQRLQMLEERLASMESRYSDPQGLEGRYAQMVSDASKLLDTHFRLHESISTNIERGQSIADDLNGINAAAEQAARDAEARNQQWIETTKNNLELMNLAQQQAALNIKEAYRERDDAQVSAQAAVQELHNRAEAQFSGRAPVPPTATNPFEQPPQADNTPPPVAVDPHEQPTTPPPPALQPGMNLPEENPRLAAQLAAATQERMEGNTDV